MTNFNKTRATFLAFVMAAIGATNAHATTVNLADGTLAQASTHPQGVGTTQALGAAFNAANGPMTFAGTLSRESNQVALGGSRYNLGMTIGNVYVLLHPGCCGGAFRLNAVNPTTSLVGNAHVGNQNIGYTPDFSDVSFAVLLTAMGVNYSIDVSIVQASGASSMRNYTLAQSLFGTGGSISSFGALHNGLGVGYGTLGYSNFTASVAAVPLPAGLSLFLLALGGLGVASRRRKMA